MITSQTLDRPDCVMFTHIIRGRGFQRRAAWLHYMVFLITYNGILNMNKRQKCQLSLPFLPPCALALLSDIHSDWNDGGGADLPVVGRRASWETVVEREAVAKTRKERDGSREVMVCIGADNMYHEGVRPNGDHAEMRVGGVHDGLVRVPCIDVGTIV